MITDYEKFLEIARRKREANPQDRRDQIMRRIFGDAVRHRFFCPKHGAYSAWLPQGADPNTFPHACPLCEKEEADAKQFRQELIGRLYRVGSEAQSFISETGVMQPAMRTFEEFDPKTHSQSFALGVCKRFSAGFVGRLIKGKGGLGMNIHGEWGTGKTHLAGAILSDLKRQGLPGVLLKAADLADALNQDPQRVSGRIGVLCRVSCLVLDDIGMSSLTESEQKRLWQIIDGRIQANLPTIFTSNLDAEELEKTLDKRIVSRIKGSTYDLLIIGPDFRRTNEVTFSDLFGDAS